MRSGESTLYHFDFRVLKLSVKFKLLIRDYPSLFTG